MPTTTTRLSLVKPVPSDTVAELRTAIGTNADIAEAMIGPHTSGPLSSRPAAGLLDRYYYANDKARLYRDSGTAWTVVAGYTPHAHAVGTSGQFNQVFGVQTYPGVALPQCSVTMVCSGAPVEINASARLRQGNSSSAFDVALALTYDGGLPPGCSQDNVEVVAASLPVNVEAELAISGLTFTPSAGTHTFALVAYNPAGLNWWAVGNRRRITVRELLA